MYCVTIIFLSWDIASWDYSHRSHFRIYIWFNKFNFMSIYLLTEWYYGAQHCGRSERNGWYYLFTLSFISKYSLLSSYSGSGSIRLWGHCIEWKSTQSPASLSLQAINPIMWFTALKWRGSQVKRCMKGVWSSAGSPEGFSRADMQTCISSVCT